MSENAHDYQVSTDVPQEQVSIENVSNAIDEKLIETQRAQHPNANDIENEQSEQVEPDTQNEQENQKYNSKFAALSRKEKEIRLREQEVEHKLAEFEAKMAEFQTQNQAEPQAEPELPLEYQLKKDPLKTLETLGISYEDLTKMVLNDGEMSTDMQLRLMREEMERDYKSKFNELENKLTEKEKAEEEAKYNKVISDFKTDINQFVDGSEQYELIQANEAYDLVYDVIEQYYQENGRILDTAEAADQVEEYLTEELKKVLEKSKKLGNWKSEASQRVAENVTRQSPTLSNSHSVVGADKKTDNLLSREESIAKLAPLIKWED